MKNLRNISIATFFLVIVQFTYAQSTTNCTRDYFGGFTCNTTPNTQPSYGITWGEINDMARSTDQGFQQLQQNQIQYQQLQMQMQQQQILMQQQAEMQRMREAQENAAQRVQLEALRRDLYNHNRIKEEQQKANEQAFYNFIYYTKNLLNEQLSKKQNPKRKKELKALEESLLNYANYSMEFGRLIKDDSSNGECHYRSDTGTATSLKTTAGKCSASNMHMININNLSQSVTFGISKATKPGTPFELGDIHVK